MQAHCTAPRAPPFPAAIGVFRVSIPSLRATSPMPILVITAHGEGSEVITGLDRGADDYLTKPFGRWDLITRVTSQLAGYHDGPATTVGRLQLLPEKSQVLLDGQPIPLSRTEASVLARLMAADGGVVSSTELLRSPWGYRRAGDNRVVVSMVARLRAKLGDDPTDPQILLDEPGRGYRISTSTRSATPTEPPLMALRHRRIQPRTDGRGRRGAHRYRLVHVRGLGWRRVGGGPPRGCG